VTCYSCYLHDSATLGPYTGGGWARIGAGVGGFGRFAGRFRGGILGSISPKGALFLLVDFRLDTLQLQQLAKTRLFKLVGSLRKEEIGRS
jgi:hypothetical protein